MKEALKLAIPSQINVLVVDDSPLAIEIIGRMLAGAPEIRIVGTAHNGLEALRLIERLRPDVVCTDLHMPKMNGLELIRAVMARHPIPILVMSNSLQAGQKDNIFEMLEAGAVDVLAKPLGGMEDGFRSLARDLIVKIRVLSGVKVIRRHAVVLPVAPVNAAVTREQRPAQEIRMIGLGSSTGGPQALEQILSRLPRDFPVPLVCIQHIASGFMRGLVDWLAGSCRIRVRMAEEGAMPLPGHAYFAAEDRHLQLDAAGRFHFSGARPAAGHRPSIDISFASLARHYGQACAGFLLTGMGEDGVQGLREIDHAGGLTFAQDEASSVVFGMPKRAIELGVAQTVLSLDQVAATLISLAGKPVAGNKFYR